MTFLADSKSYLSPLVGYAAKNTDLLYNLRFFGNYTPGYVNGTRSYADDAAGDRMWAIVKILFPSTGGGLTTSSAAIGNFGKNITDTKPVSALLALIVHLRSVQHEIDDLNVIAAEQFQRGDRDGGRKTKLSVKLRFPTLELLRDKYKVMFGNSEYEQMCFHIHKLMSNSESNLANLGYPEFLIEQVLIGFIMVHFNGPHGYIDELPRDFLAFESHPTISKIREFVIETEAKMHPTAFGRFAHVAISNGNARIFDRTNGVMLKDMFPDCCETAIRHVCTLLLWDATTQRIRSCVNEDINEFYATHAPNDGSISVRSAWNAIVGDLNVGIGGGPRIKYQDRIGPAEFNMTGPIDNYVLILMRLFKLETPDLVEKYLDLGRKPSVPKLEQLMSEIFNLISPNKYTCVFSKPFATDGIYDGQLEITFTSNAPVTFMLIGSEYHGEVKIRTEEDENEKWKTKVDHSTDEVLPKEIPSSFQAFRTLGLPIRQDSFYARMCINLQNNIGIVRYLNTVLHFGSRGTSEESQTLQNVMTAFIWENDDITDEMSNAIVRLVRANLHISDIRKKISKLSIFEFEYLDVPEILGIQKTGVRFLTGAVDNYPSLRNIVPDANGIYTYRKGGWILECIQAEPIGPATDDTPQITYFVKSVVIPNYIRELGWKFMYWSIKLESIEIPRSVTRIGNDFLQYADQLKSIRIPSSVTHIGHGFMLQAMHLETAIIEAPIKSIGDRFLCLCMSLRRFEMPNTVTTIDKGFLQRSEKLRAIKLSSSLESIDDHFMYGCLLIERISIPKTVTSIGSNFMESCTGLKRVELSGPVRISSHFLSACPNLKEFSLAGFGTGVKLTCWDGTVRIYPRGTVLTEADSAKFKLTFNTLITRLFSAGRVEAM